MPARLSKSGTVLFAGKLRKGRQFLETATDGKCMWFWNHRWKIGGYALLLGGAVAFGLVLVRTVSGPYRFLAGRTPVTSAPGGEKSVYRIPGDFDELNGRVSAELVRAGFARTMEERSSTERVVAYSSLDGRHLVHLLWSAESPLAVEVWIGDRNDRRVLSFNSLIGVLRAPFLRINLAHLTNFCIANQKQIEGAKATWALEQKANPDAFVRGDVLYGEGKYIRLQLYCPEGGYYWLGRVSEPVRCSISSHNKSR